MTAHADRAGGTAGGTGGAGGTSGPDGTRGAGDTSGAGRAGDAGRLDRWKALGSRYALLPLRIFLGVTFIYAAFDKLTDSAFFADSGTGSIGEMMTGVRDSSAIPALVDLALKNPPASATPSPSGSSPSGSGPSWVSSPAWRPSVAPSSP